MIGLVSFCHRRLRPRILRPVHYRFLQRCWWFSHQFAIRFCLSLAWWPFFFSTRPFSAFLTHSFFWPVLAHPISIASFFFLGVYFVCAFLETRSCTPQGCLGRSSVRAATFQQFARLLSTPMAYSPFWCWFGCCPWDSPGFRDHPKSSEWDRSAHSWLKNGKSVSVESVYSNLVWVCSATAFFPFPPFSCCMRTPFFALPSAQRFSFYCIVACVFWALRSRILLLIRSRPGPVFCRPEPTELIPPQYQNRKAHSPPPDIQHQFRVLAA